MHSNNYTTPAPKHQEGCIPGPTVNPVVAPNTQCDPVPVENPAILPTPPAPGPATNYA